MENLVSYLNGGAGAVLMFGVDFAALRRALHDRVTMVDFASAIGGGFESGFAVGATRWARTGGQGRLLCTGSAPQPWAFPSSGMSWVKTSVRAPGRRNASPAMSASRIN